MPAQHTSYKCQDCGKDYRQRTSLARHRRMTHAERKTSFECDVCHTSFPMKQSLIRHMRKHEHHDFKCEVCNKTFYRKDKLSEHRQIHQQIGGGPEPSTSSAPIPQEPTIEIDNAVEQDENSRESHAGEPMELENESDGETDCDFEEEALNGTLLVKTIKASGLSRFDPLRFFKEKEERVKSILRKEMKKKGGIKWYASIMVQFKKQKKEETELAWPHFRGHCQTTLKSVDLEESWKETVKKMYDSFISYQRGGSAWILDFIVHIRLHIVQWKPLRGSSYIPTPIKLRVKRAIINVKNKDKKCFLWAILSALHPKKHNANLVKQYKEFQNELNMDGIDYPVKVDDILTFEKNNNISINLFGYDKHCFPIHITRNHAEKHVDLLLLSNRKQSHYCWIKDKSRLFYDTAPGHTKRHFCPYCLHGFVKESLLQSHIDYCKIHGPQKIEMPSEEDKWLYFKDIAKQLKAPWIIYADFEAATEKIQGCQPNPNMSHTQKMTKHKPSGFCYKVVGPTPDLVKPAVVYSGKDVTDTFIEHMVKVQDNIDLWYKNTKPLEMQPGDLAAFYNAKDCHICKKPMGDDRVRDHDHVTGRFRGAAHNTCNVNFRFRGRIPIVFHNLKNYDAHLIMQSIGIYQHGKLKVIPTNMEKYVSFSMGSMDFIDSYQFLGTSLEKLTSNLAQEGVDKFQHLKNECESKEEVDLLLRKGVFPYSWFDDTEKFNMRRLPAQQDFYNDLNNERLSDADYQHAQNVWQHFNMKTFEEYHNLYLKNDVLLLADVFENFRTLSMDLYDLDPAHFYTAPGLAWNAALKYTGVRLELFTDPNMHLFIEAGLRGGISMISHRYAKANNPYMSDYSPDEPKSYISYVDANNLYGWAMSKPLPTHGFRWLGEDEIKTIDIKSLTEDAEDGYFLEVDLEYPQNLHDSHSDYPLAPESRCIDNDMISPFCKDLAEDLGLNINTTRKLIPNLNNKEKYVVHYRNLQQYMKYGLKLRKIHRVMTFKQSRWLKSYIDLNTERRKMAKNAFEKDLFKLMNNSVFGKTMENLRKRRNIELVHKDKRLRKLVCKPSFYAFDIFNEDLAAVELRKTKLYLNRPIYCGFTILDVSKTLMYNYHYEHIVPTYGSNATLLFTDTDSLCYHIYTDDIYTDMSLHRDLYDTSDFPKNHSLFSEDNKKVIGKFKDETAGVPPSEFVGLKPKMYSLLVNGEAKKTAKGVNRAEVKNNITHDDYRKAVLNYTLSMDSMKQFRSFKHEIYMLKINKITLNPYDDKRYVLDDGITTLAHGHYRIDRESLHQSDVMLKHPFTMIAAGPTSSGKTWLMKRLIQNAKQYISPVPRRIIWCYGQWQSAYEELRSYPQLEFVKGIPEDIDDPRYLDTSMPTLIVLDDLMNEATNDQRICDLYSKGSHHRNLSVICLLQNMYHQGKMNRSMSLNSHYMILFNNPRDRQQVAFLSRQMYPGNGNKLVRAYTNATSRPYGYLLLDLKQETPEHNRLKPNAFSKDEAESKSPEYSYKQPTNDAKHLVEMQNSSESNHPATAINRGDTINYPYLESNVRQDNMVSCDDCGLIFDSIHDLQRHIKNWCQDQGPLVKRMKIQSTPHIEDNIPHEEDDDLRANETFAYFKKWARKSQEKDYQEKVDEYMDRGMDKEEAMEKAKKKLLSKVKDKFMENYKQLVKLSFGVADNALHRNIVDAVSNMMRRGISRDLAIKKILLKNKHKFDELFTDDTDDEGTGSSEEEESESENEADESDDE